MFGLYYARFVCGFLAKIDIAKYIFQWYTLIINAALLIVDGDRHKPVRKSRGCLFFHLLCIVFPLRSDYLRFVHPQATFCRQSGG